MLPRPARETAFTRRGEQKPTAGTPKPEYLHPWQAGHIASDLYFLPPAARKRHITYPNLADAHKR